MNQGLIPRRYAKALYKFALDHGTDSRLYELMTTLSTSFDDNAALSQTMSNPFVSAADKTSLLTTAAGATASDKEFADFLHLLVDNNRLDMARAIALAYREIYRKAHNIYVVDVTSATPLDADSDSRLRKMIESRLGGGTMEYTSHVDPDIIGGFVVRIDNERLDASVANELIQLRHKLIK